MDLTIYEKLSNLRDKYPENTNLIGELVLVAFKNNNVIPEDEFTLNGMYEEADIIKILKELNISFNKIIASKIVDNTYTLHPRTEVTLKLD